MMKTKESVSESRLTWATSAQTEKDDDGTRKENKKKPRARYFYLDELDTIRKMGRELVDGRWEEETDEEEEEESGEDAMGAAPR